MWGFGDLDNQCTGTTNMQEERSYFINALINLLGILNLILWRFGLAPQHQNGQGTILRLIFM